MTVRIDRAIDALSHAAWIDDAHIAQQFVRFLIGNKPVGWLTHSFAGVLREWPDVFAHDAGCVRMIAGIDDEPCSTRIIAGIIDTLAKRNVITGWRDELYPVRVNSQRDGGGDENADGDRAGAEHGERDRVPLLYIERAAARAFGITSDAVHVNGVTVRNGDNGRPALWIARRSASKSIDPGMRDNLIGGGVPAGLSIRETLVKEAWEEAGLDAVLASSATEGRRLRIRRVVPEGLQSESVFVHDLWLPDGVAPRNQDGEVSEFRLLDIDEVLLTLEQGSDGRDPMTVDASLVTIDWLERQHVVAIPETDACRAVFGRRT